MDAAESLPEAEWGPVERALRRACARNLSSRWRHPTFASDAYARSAPPTSPAAQRWSMVGALMYATGVSLVEHPSLKDPLEVLIATAPKAATNGVLTFGVMQLDASLTDVQVAEWWTEAIAEAARRGV